jgi:anti-sigma-K factor RskA
VSEVDQFREMAEAYALGALDADDRAAFEAHLASGCDACAKAVSEARWLVSHLVYLAPEATPAKDVKDRLMQTVHAEAGVVPITRQKRKKAAVPVWLWAGVAALLLLTAYSSWDARRLQEQIRQTNERAAAELQRRKELEQELASAKRQAMILMDPASTRIALTSPNKDMPPLEAKWHAQLGLVVMGHQMPKLANNRVLQLWLIPKDSNAKPMSCMTFWPEPDGKVAKVMADLPGSMEDMKALAITEEPMGGSPQPTSAPIWVGAIS